MEVIAHSSRPKTYQSRAFIQSTNAFHRINHSALSESVRWRQTRQTCLSGGGGVSTPYNSLLPITPYSHIVVSQRSPLRFFPPHTSYNTPANVSRVVRSLSLNLGGCRKTGVGTLAACYKSFQFYVIYSFECWMDAGDGRESNRIGGELWRS